MTRKKARQKAIVKIPEGGGTDISTYLAQTAVHLRDPLVGAVHGPQICERHAQAALSLASFLPGKTSLTVEKSSQIAHTVEELYHLLKHPDVKVLPLNPSPDYLADLLFRSARYLY